VARPAAGSSVNKGPAAKAGLPVARPIDESGKMKALPATPIQGPVLNSASLSATELLNRGKLRSKPAAPQWFWWAVAGGAVLAVVLLIIVFLSQL
jgi:hypothetical protein